MTADTPEIIVKQVLDVSRETFERLTVYHDLLVQWQKRINLISPTTVDHIWPRHIADSLQLSSILPHAKSIIDIGSGAGFPGLILAILMAERGGGSVDLIESSGKKCAFMNAVVRECGLRDQGVNVTVHNQRIENSLGTLQKPDAVTARALSPLNQLLGLTECFLSEGAVGVFPKGRDHQVEIEEAQKNWTFTCESSDSQLQDGSVILKISQLKRR